MSMEYYLACKYCKKCYLVGQDGWKFFTFYSGEPACMAGIGKFIEDHVLCDGNITLISEGLVMINDYEEIKWP